MKRIALAIVAVAAETLSLAACSSTGSPAAGGKPSLLLWVDTPRVPQAEMYKKLMAGKEDIKIEVIAQGDAQTKIALHNRTKSGWPDAIFGSAADTALFRDPSNGYAADLTPLVSKKIFDGVGQGNSDCKFDGKYYCLKNDLANTVLWYNTKIFTQLNLTVPKTMDEFAATALKLKGTGYSAGAIGDQNYYASFLQSSECPLAAVPSKNTVRIAPGNAKCTRVANLVQPLLDAGVVDKRSSFDAGFIADVASKDKVAMTLGPSWFGDFVIKPAASWAVPAGGIAAADAAVWLTTSDAMATATTTPTFPAYGPANKLWEARISANKYYVSNPYPAMAAGANNISQLDRPVRFAFYSQLGSTLQADINSGNGAQQSVIGRPEIALAGLVVAIPILIVFLLSSWLLVRGVLAGSVKS